MQATAYNFERRPLKILIVEDNIEQVRSLAKLLRELGHQIDYAINGYAALTLAERFQPDVVIIDIGLPGMDGFHMFDEMKRMPELKGVKAIAFTAYDTPEIRDRAKASGFSEFIVKPQALNQWAHLFGDLSS